MAAPKPRSTQRQVQHRQHHSTQDSIQVQHRQVQGEEKYSLRRRLGRSGALQGRRRGGCCVVAGDGRGGRCCWAVDGADRRGALLGQRRWRTWGGGDGEREVERRGRRRRHEGGGEEGEATATGDLGDAARAWRFGGAGAGPGQPRTGSRVPLQLVFWEKTRIIQVQGGLQDPIANSLKPMVTTKATGGSSRVRTSQMRRV